MPVWLSVCLSISAYLRKTSNKTIWPFLLAASQTDTPKYIQMDSFSCLLASHRETRKAALVTDTISLNFVTVVLWQSCCCWSTGSNFLWLFSTSSTRLQLSYYYPTKPLNRGLFIEFIKGRFVGWGTDRLEEIENKSISTLFHGLLALRCRVLPNQLTVIDKMAVGGVSLIAVSMKWFPMTSLAED